MEPHGNETIIQDYAPLPPDDGMIYALVVFGTVLGIFLLITGCETMTEMCRRTGLRQLLSCRRSTTNESALNTSNESHNRHETLV